MLNQAKFEEILSRVQRPGRYLGNEWNVVKKDLRNSRLRFALAFPDLYEVGMSHLGFKLIYHLLNNRPDIACERVFSVNIDLEKILRAEAIPLFTLESRADIASFDIIGFSLAYELNYTNLLNILDMAGVPLTSSERGENEPIVIAGGPSSFNPEPLSDFIDLFIIGEAEEVLFECIDAVIASKEGGHYNKENLLKELSHIEGVYVPSVYRNTNPPTIRKRVIADLENSFYPTKQIVPYIGIVHDRLSVEIMRGCPHLCRFCQARTLYHHKRERSARKVLELCEEGLKETGYEEVSLLSLSSGSHSHIISIIQSIIKKYYKKGVNISLPSLRVDKIIKEFPELLSNIRISGLTLAPEAGSSRLRSVINKGIDIDELKPAIEAAVKFGWKRVKLYFMIGLPTEEYKDIDEMIDAVNSMLNIDRRLQINVSISSFIPKPHTPFQWEGMFREEELNSRLNYIMERLTARRVKIKFQNTKVSILEGIISRGDMRLGRVILRAFKKGCRFDSWSEHFNYGAWMEAFKEEGVDPYSYIYEKRDFEAKLPWDHIDPGITHSHLISEAKKIKTSS
ncbi:MAG: TIGR03960 family B12-binding radical SAM protein [Candidatus Omnitrophica bacterium]|nr:TIGR03960 family B12-binding radical SAM protein [Candidatus Omnitrophota bacterium]